MKASTSRQSQGRTRVTREQVAKRAGVSGGTVSLSLRGDTRIKSSTRQLVQMIAKEMNYRPHASAGALAHGKTYTVGLVFSNPQFSEDVLAAKYAPAVMRVSRELSYRNYHMNLDVRSAVEGAKGSRRLSRMFNEIGVEGFVVIHSPGSALLDGLKDQGVPFVVLDGKPPRDGGVGVYVDERRSAELAVEHLVAMGHRRIASLATLSVPDSEQLVVGHRMEEFPRGYFQAMAKAGLPAFAGWDDPCMNLADQLEKLWLQPDPPTGLITYDDADARRVIDVLMRRGLTVPRDVSVVALHDVGVSELDYFSSPTITCNADLQSEMAASATDKLLQLIEDPQNDQCHESVIMQPQLIVRKSSGPCPSPDLNSQ